MIEKALPGLFRVISDEAAANPVFARRLEDSLSRFAEELTHARVAEQGIASFHPFIEYKKATPETFLARLMKFDARELRLLVEKHNLDPASVLRPRAAKKALAEHVLTAAAKRAERDARLFEY